MRTLGIPFLVNYTQSNDNEAASGVRISLFSDVHKGNYDGAIIGGLGCGVTGIDNSSGQGNNLRGVAVGGLVSRVSGDVTGALFSGAFNSVGGDLSEGASVTGGVTDIKGDSHGGICISGLWNEIAGDASNYNVCLLVNSMDSCSPGNTINLNVAGLANYVAGYCDAINVAGIGNFVQGLHGLCVGLINAARTNDGGAFQFGLVNHMSKYSGKGPVFQIGLYNRIGGRTIPIVNWRFRKSHIEEVVSSQA